MIKSTVDGVPQLPFVNLDLTEATGGQTQKTAQVSMLTPSAGDSWQIDVEVVGYAIPPLAAEYLASPKLSSR